MNTIENTWAVDLNPRYQPLPEDKAMMFSTAVICEMQNVVPSEEDKASFETTFIVRILDLRIEVFKLPIAFTFWAKVAAFAMVDSPGAMVVLLIDCLNAFKGRGKDKPITVSDLADLYPIGFYAGETLERYVNEYLKPRYRPDHKHPRIEYDDVYGSTT